MSKRQDVLLMNTSEIVKYSNRLMRLRMKSNMPQSKPYYKKTIEVLDKVVQQNKQLNDLVNNEVLGMLSDDDYHYVVAILNNMDGFSHEKQK